MDDKYDKILGQVRALIAKADSTEFPQEADALRAKAESLMLKYRIEEAIVFEKEIGTAQGLEPVWLDMTLSDIDSEYGVYYRQVSGAVLHHVGGRGMIDYVYDTRTVILKAVGFQSDLRYAEVLLTSCLLEFGKRLEPKFNPNLTDGENAWNLRSAGWERKRIARELFGDWTTENEMKAKNRKVTRLIKEHGAKIGEDPMELLGRGNNMATYRESYAAGFVNTINSRLYYMRTEATEMNGGGLVPASRKEAVDEAYYIKYPHMRPKEAKPGEQVKMPRVRIPKVREKAINQAAYSRGRTAAYDVNLGADGAGRRLPSD